MLPALCTSIRRRPSRTDWVVMVEERLFIANLMLYTALVSDSSDTVSFVSSAEMPSEPRNVCNKCMQQAQAMPPPRPPLLIKYHKPGVPDLCTNSV